MLTTRRSRNSWSHGGDSTNHPRRTRCRVTPRMALLMLANEFSQVRRTDRLALGVKGLATIPSGTAQKPWRIDRPSRRSSTQVERPSLPFDGSRAGVRIRPRQVTDDMDQYLYRGNPPGCHRPDQDSRGRVRLLRKRLLTPAGRATVLWLIARLPGVTYQGVAKDASAGPPTCSRSTSGPLGGPELGCPSGAHASCRKTAAPASRK